MSGICVVRTWRLVTVALCLGLLSYGQTSVPDKADVIRKIQKLYYTPTEMGLHSFSCKVEVDWRSILQQLRFGKEITPDDSRLVYLDRARITFTATSDGKVEIDGGPSLGGTTKVSALLDSIKLNAQNMAGAMLRQWLEFLDGRFMPSPDDDFELESKADGYYVTEAERGTIGRQHYTPDFLLAESRETQKNGTNVDTFPIFTRTVRGLLLSGIDESIGKSGSWPKTMIMRGDYQNLGNYWIPSKLTVKGAGGQFDFAFQNCRINEVSPAINGAQPGNWQLILVPDCFSTQFLTAVCDSLLVMSIAETCPKCDGEGMLVLRRPDGRFAAEPCDCRHEARVTALLERARIPKRYQHCSFESYTANFTGADPSLANARLMARKFVDGYPVTTEDHGLLLVGPKGVGKTHLAVGILHSLVVEKGVRGLFCDYLDLLKKIQESYSPQVLTTELEILRPVFEAEVLVLDDLGASKPSAWVWDTVALIVNRRYNERRTTIITTNLADKPAGAKVTDLERAVSKESLGDRIGDRMHSRLAEMCVTVQMNGADFRQGVGRARFG